MSSRELYKKADRIIGVLSEIPEVHALLATGSLGGDPQWVDAYSDLDLIVLADHPEALLENIGWLSRAGEVSYLFRYSSNCIKLFFADHVFCELSCIVPEELSSFPLGNVSVLWSRKGFALPQIQHTEYCEDSDWLLQELLVQLYIGLCKYHRGEVLAACGYIYGRSIDLLARLIYSTRNRADNVPADRFDKTRRFEAAYAELTDTVPHLIQGYDHLCESAAALLEYLSSSFNVDLQISSEIQRLIAKKNKKIL